VKDALKRGEPDGAPGICGYFSFDMLGEGARTAADAERYLKAYQSAIEQVARQQGQSVAPEVSNGVSVKLSALHPRYEAVNETASWRSSIPACQGSATGGGTRDINHRCGGSRPAGLSLEADRRPRARSVALPAGTGSAWPCRPIRNAGRGVIDWLKQLAGDTRSPLHGAAGEGRLLGHRDQARPGRGAGGFPGLHPQAGDGLPAISPARESCFEASPVSIRNSPPTTPTPGDAILEMADSMGVTAFEFQRLHGMGEALYAAAKAGNKVRVYAPVGAHKDLLPYLVRRLLENGANTSFVHSFLDPDVPAEQVVADPITKVEAGPRRHPRIPDAAAPLWAGTA
jgi:RHH-type proline utilization regulon transcriptional repressor/proline dehydrogenase/delta 1-pyrroline-5-carboxylate dehydrogenase